MVKPNIPKFLYYYLGASFFLKEKDALCSGSTQSALNDTNAKKIKIPLPPIEEQNRIVAKIESLFSELDKSIESLQAAKNKLTLYRQSVLKSAFEGELTKEWREAHQDELEDAEVLLERIKKEREEAYEKSLDEWKEAVKVWEENGKDGKKPAKPRKPKKLPPLKEKELEQFLEVPFLWSIVKLGLLIEDPKYGTSKKSDYKINGTGVLRIPNIMDSYIDDSDLKYAQFNEYEKEVYSLKVGDLLTIRSNGSIGLVGKTALISKKDQKYLYAGYLIRLRPYKVLNSKYLLYLFSSTVIRNQIEVKARSTSGVNNINSQEIVNMLMPICSEKEQIQIVNEIESRFSEGNILQKTIDTELKKAEQLKQSILKEAFEGKLVSRDLNDEPVSELLNRIQEEKQLFLEQEKIKSKNRRKKVFTRKERHVMNVLQILEQQTGWTSAQRVFEKYTDKNDTDTIEIFYQELRKQLNEKKIEIIRKNDSDHLRIPKLQKGSL